MTSSIWDGVLNRLDYRSYTTPCCSTQWNSPKAWCATSLALL